MDARVPDGVAESRGAQTRVTSRKGARYHVLHGSRLHEVVELGRNGFVIEADGRPPLRGFADILQGEERILHGLVMCTWARDGLVGYEFKRETPGHHVPADYVLPTHSGLLSGPT